MYYTYCESPIGTLLLAGDGSALTHIAFARAEGPAAPDAAWIRREAPFAAAKGELAAYFAGELRRFSVPVAPAGTPFQLRVLEQLQRIPYGETRSYGEIAQAIGRPAAPRAVGAANGRNPIPIVIPCHRVIGSRGELTGFAGGLETKRFLLELERPTQHSLAL